MGKPRSLNYKGGKKHGKPPNENQPPCREPQAWLGPAGGSAQQPIKEEIRT